LELAVSIGEHQHFDSARHVFQIGLRIKITLFGFEDTQVGDDSGGVDGFIFPG